MTYRETMHSEEGFTTQEQAEYENWLDNLSGEWDYELEEMLKVE